MQRPMQYPRTAMPWRSPRSSPLSQSPELRAERRALKAHSAVRWAWATRILVLLAVYIGFEPNDGHCVLQT
jgi:hypothetical protein